ncbi:MAG: alpha/beta hydrolase [Chlamydiae bacterium]|nr:alpha/beta hydrolase [Chlamydiota bacterium]
MSRLEDPIVIFSQPNSFISKGNTFRILIEEGLKRYSNCNFLIYDYRGCGESQGDPLLAKEFILDGEAVYQFVKDQLQVPPMDIHMLGYSFGGSVSAQVKAMHPECSGNYVTDRSFSSVPEVAAERFTNKIISFTACRLLHFLGWNILNSTEALAKIKSRVLVIFHPEDLTIKGISQLYKKVPQWTNFFYMNLAQRSFRAVSNALVHGVALHSFENEKGEKAHIEALDFLLKKVIY